MHKMSTAMSGIKAQLLRQAGNIKVFDKSRHMWFRVMRDEETITLPPTLPFSPKTAQSLSTPIFMEPSSSASSFQHGWSHKLPCADSGGWIVDIGFTQRGIEDIGDISSFRTNHHLIGTAASVLSSSSVTNKGSTSSRIFPYTVQAGDRILEIEWEAQKITMADELYHTVWETVCGVIPVDSPISGHVIDIIPQQAVLSHDLDSNDTLIRLRTEDHLTLTNMLKRMVNETEYWRSVEKGPRGIFAEDV